MDPDPEALRRRGDDLLAGRRFAEARAAFEAALAVTEDAATVAGLGIACRALDDIPASVAAFERAYHLHAEAGRAADAGVVACTLADIELSERGAAAVASGWLGRARRHLDAVPDHPGHVSLEGIAAYHALAYDKDPDVAGTHARAAIDHARRIGDAEAELHADAYLGLVEVSAGDLRSGFARLDGSTAAAMTGEIDAVAGLDMYCLMLTACERVRDYDRVDQWAQRVLAIATEVGSDAFATFARTQYANLLIWRGRWDEADVELQRVLRDAEGRPLTAAMGMVLLATLRRRQGRLEDAHLELARAEREPYRSGVRHLVLAARARLELDRGNAADAADTIERYLRLVSPRDHIERIEALETLALARAALGDADAATAAAGLLQEAAELVPTDGVQGSAHHAAGHAALARGETAAGVAALEQAVAAFVAARLPHEVVVARLALARALAATGAPDRARPEAEAALAEAEELGAAGDADAARQLLAGLRAGTTAHDTLTPREVEVLRLVADGRSNAEIADALVLSVRTIERHVSNIYLKVGATGPSARTTAVAYGRRAGLL